MTLVAAFRSYGVPALIGDLLITTPGGSESRRKKVRIIADRFAIAWTGHLIAAHTVVEALQTELGMRSPTRKILESILTKPKFAELGSLHVTLIGWIVEDTTAHCFRWNSSYPIEVFYGDPMYDGSGDFEAHRFLGNAGPHSSDPNAMSDREDVVAGVLYTVTNLMKAEVVGPSTKHLGFGFAYEAILLNEERRFEYIDNILYYSLVHELDIAGRYLSSRLIGNQFKVTDRAGNSVIYVFDPERNCQSRYVITPVGLSPQTISEALIAQLAAEPTAFPISSAYYCSFLWFEAPDFICPPVVEYFGGEKSLELIDLSDPTIFSLKIDVGRVEWMYRCIKADMTE
jgi:hypothetical protein